MLFGQRRNYRCPMPRWQKALAALLAAWMLWPQLSWALNPQIYDRGLEAVIPRQWGTVVRTSALGEKTVICIQDLHCHAEVQQHIAGIIRRLAEQSGLKLVAEEGAAGSLDLTPLRRFPDRMVAAEVGEYFIRQGKLSGAEFAALTSPSAIRIEGLEDGGLYQASLEQVRGFLNTESQGLVADLQDSLDAIKPKLYSQSLSDFDESRRAYQESRISLLQYCLQLQTWAAKHHVRLNGYLNFKRFLSSRPGEAVDPDALFADMDAVDRAVRSALYTRPDQSRLDDLVRRAEIIERLLNISAAPEELRDFRGCRSAYRMENFLDFLRQHQADLEALVDLPALEARLVQTEAFYRMADERSVRFVDNLLGRMAATGQELSVMIHGGFHTEKILSELQARGVRFLAVKPVLSQPDVLNPYFDLLQNRKSPLEKLLEKNQNILALPSRVHDPVFLDEYDLIAQACGRVMDRERYLAGYQARVALVPFQGGAAAAVGKDLAHAQLLAVPKIKDQGGLTVLAVKGGLPGNLRRALERMSFFKHQVHLAFYASGEAAAQDVREAVRPGSVRGSWQAAAVFWLRKRLSNILNRSAWPAALAAGMTSSWVLVFAVGALAVLQGQDRSVQAPLFFLASIPTRAQIAALVEKRLPADGLVTRVVNPQAYANYGLPTAWRERLEQAVDAQRGTPTVPEAAYREFRRHGLAWIDRNKVNQVVTYWLVRPGIFRLAGRLFEQDYPGLSPAPALADYIQFHLKLHALLHFFQERSGRKTHYRLVENIRQRLADDARYPQMLADYQRRYGPFTTAKGALDEAALLQNLLAVHVSGRVLGLSGVTLKHSSGQDYGLEAWWPAAAAALQDALWFLEARLERTAAQVFKSPELLRRYRATRQAQAQAAQAYLTALQDIPATVAAFEQRLTRLEPGLENRLQEEYGGDGHYLREYLEEDLRYLSERMEGISLLDREHTAHLYASVKNSLAVLRNEALFALAVRYLGEHGDSAVTFAFAHHAPLARDKLELFGDRLDAWCLADGWTDVALAQASGIPVKTIRAWRANRHAPDPGQLPSLARALSSRAGRSLTPVDLLYGQGLVELMKTQDRWGGRLRSLRQLAGLTQEALGRSVGVNDRTIMRWENESSTHHLNTETVRLLAQALSGALNAPEISFSLLFYGATTAEILNRAQVRDPHTGDWIPLNFGMREEAVRYDKNVSEAALTAALGLGPQTVGKWKSGGILPVPPVLKKIAALYRVEIPQLLYGRTLQALIAAASSPGSRLRWIREYLGLYQPQMEAALRSQGLTLPAKKPVMYWETDQKPVPEEVLHAYSALLTNLSPKRLRVTASQLRYGKSLAQLLKALDPADAASEGRALHYSRLNAGLTVEAVAQAAGVSSVTVRAWERGQEAVPAERLPDLEAAFKAADQGSARLFASRLKSLARERGKRDHPRKRGEAIAAALDPMLRTIKAIVPLVVSPWILFPVLMGFLFLAGGGNDAAPFVLLGTVLTRQQTLARIAERLRTNGKGLGQLNPAVYANYGLPIAWREQLQQRVEARRGSRTVSENAYRDFQRMGLAWLDHDPHLAANVYETSRLGIRRLADQWFQEKFGQDDVLPELRKHLRFHLRIHSLLRLLNTEFDKKNHYRVVANLRQRLVSDGNYEILLEDYQRRYGSFRKNGGSLDEEALLQNMLAVAVSNRVLGIPGVQLENRRGEVYALESWWPAAAAMLQDELWFLEPELEAMAAGIFRSPEIVDRYRNIREQQAGASRRFFNAETIIPTTATGLERNFLALAPLIEEELQREYGGTGPYFSVFLEEDLAILADALEGRGTLDQASARRLHASLAENLVILKDAWRFQLALRFLTNKPGNSAALTSDFQVLRARDRLELFGERLDALCMAGGWSNSELAKVSGIPESRISAWRALRSMPEPVSLPALARALSTRSEALVTPAYLLFGRELSEALKSKKRWGERLRLLRELAGLSQEALGHRIGVSDHTIIHWEQTSVAPADADVVGVLAWEFRRVLSDPEISGALLYYGVTLPELLNNDQVRDPSSGRLVPVTFGMREEAQRFSMGINREHLARAMGVIPATIGKWKNRGQAPPLSLAKRLADFLWLEVTQLMFGKKLKPLMAAAASPGPRVRAIRENLGFNQSEMANVLSQEGVVTVSKKHITHWETDQWTVSEEALRAYAQLARRQYARRVRITGLFILHGRPLQRLLGEIHPDDPQALSRALKYTRLEAGLSAQELAESVGVTRKTCMAWEAGSKKITPAMVAKLITAVSGKDKVAGRFLAKWVASLAEAREDDRDLGGLMPWLKEMYIQYRLRAHPEIAVSVGRTYQSLVERYETEYTRRAWLVEALPLGISGLAVFGALLMAIWTGFYDPQATLAAMALLAFRAAWMLFPLGHLLPKKAGREALRALRLRAAYETFTPADRSNVKIASVFAALNIALSFTPVPLWGLIAFGLLGHGIMNLGLWLVRHYPGWDQLKDEIIVRTSDFEWRTVEIFFKRADIWGLPAMLRGWAIGGFSLWRPARRLPKFPVEGTAAEEFIAVLELEKARLLKGPEKDPDTGLLIYRIRTPRRWQPWRPPRGLQVLDNELAPVREFDLLVDPQDGQIDAIFPAMTRPIWRVRWGVGPRYFDLTAYGFKIPDLADPGMQAQWMRLGQIRMAKQERIERYRKIRNLWWLSPVEHRGHQSYLLAEVIPGLGAPALTAFEPEDWLTAGRREKLEDRLRSGSGPPRLLVPVYPTVYPPAETNNSMNDMLYHLHVYASSLPLRGKNDSKILVVGPGSGLDTWLAALGSGQKLLYAVGINPLEVANCRVMARMAGIEVDARVHDNILNRRNQSIFGSLAFDRVYSNAPFFKSWPEHAGERLLFWLFTWWKPLAGYADGDHGAFINGLSRGLAKVLKIGEGLAVVWYRDTHPETGKILQQAGLHHQIADSDDEDVLIYHIKRPPPQRAKEQASTTLNASVVPSLLTLAVMSGNLWAAAGIAAALVVYHLFRVTLRYLVHLSQFARWISMYFPDPRQTSFYDNRVHYSQVELEYIRRLGDDFARHARARWGELSDRMAPAEQLLRVQREAMLQKSFVRDYHAGLPVQDAAYFKKITADILRFLDATQAPGNLGFTYVAETGDPIPYAIKWFTKFFGAEPPMHVMISMGQGVFLHATGRPSIRRVTPVSALHAFCHNDGNVALRRLPVDFNSNEVSGRLRKFALATINLPFNFKRLSLGWLGRWFPGVICTEYVLSALRFLDLRLIPAFQPLRLYDLVAGFVMLILTAPLSGLIYAAEGTRGLLIVLASLMPFLYLNYSTLVSPYRLLKGHVAGKPLETIFEPRKPETGNLGLMIRFFRMRPYDQRLWEHLFPSRWREVGILGLAVVSGGVMLAMAAHLFPLDLGWFSILAAWVEAHLETPAGVPAAESVLWLVGMVSAGRAPGSGKRAPAAVPLPSPQPDRSPDYNLPQSLRHRWLDQHPGMRRGLILFLSLAWFLGAAPRSAWGRDPDPIDPDTHQEATRFVEFKRRHGMTHLASMMRDDPRQLRLRVVPAWEFLLRTVFRPAQQEWEFYLTPGMLRALAEEPMDRSPGNRRGVGPARLAHWLLVASCEHQTQLYERTLKRQARQAQRGWQPLDHVLLYREPQVLREAVGSRRWSYADYYQGKNYRDLAPGDLARLFEELIREAHPQADLPTLETAPLLQRLQTSRALTALKDGNEKLLEAIQTETATVWGSLLAEYRNQAGETLVAAGILGHTLQLLAAPVTSTLLPDRQPEMNPGVDRLYAASAPRTVRKIIGIMDQLGQPRQAGTLRRWEAFRRLLQALEAAGGEVGSAVSLAMKPDDIHLLAGEIDRLHRGDQPQTRAMGQEDGLVVVSLRDGRLDTHALRLLDGQSVHRFPAPIVGEYIGPAMAPTLLAEGLRQGTLPFQAFHGRPRLMREPRTSAWMRTLSVMLHALAWGLGDRGRYWLWNAAGAAAPGIAALHLERSVQQASHDLQQAGYSSEAIAQLPLTHELLKPGSPLRQLYFRMAGNPAVLTGQAEFAKGLARFLVRQETVGTGSESQDQRSLVFASRMLEQLGTVPVIRNYAALAPESEVATGGRSLRLVMPAILLAADAGRPGHRIQGGRAAAGSLTDLMQRRGFAVDERLRERYFRRAFQLRMAASA